MPHEGYCPPLPHRQSAPVETDVSKPDVNQSSVHYLYGKGILHTYVEVKLKGRKSWPCLTRGVRCHCVHIGSVKTLNFYL